MRRTAPAHEDGWSAWSSVGIPYCVVACGPDGDVAAEAFRAHARVTVADGEGEALAVAQAVVARLQRDREVAVDGAVVRRDGERRARAVGDGDVHFARVRAELIASGV